MRAFAEAKRKLVEKGGDALKAATGGAQQQEESGGTTEAEAADTARSLEAFVDGKFMTVFMTLLTIFALWGDNVRVALFDKDADTVFYILFVIALFMFVLEFLINTVAKPDYKWGFFFVLDLISALSIIPDIPWIMSGIAYIMNGESNTTEPSSSAGLDGARTARIVRLVRLIRLIRIVKLYSMVSKAQDADQEEKLKAQARAAQNAKQAALKRIEASRLGRALSEQTTRRVIIGVLLMLFMLPLLQSSETDQSFYVGLAQLYWFGRSNCTVTTDNVPLGCGGNIQQIRVETRGSSWIGQDGWNNMLWIYSQSSFRAKYYPTHQQYWVGDPPYKLLWLRVPHYDKNGRLRDVVSVDSELGTWNQTDSCAGMQPKPSCPYRDEEMTTYSYTPIECSATTVSQTNNGLACDKAVAYARFEMKSLKRRSNALDMISTLFVCILLATLSIQFQNDTQKLVIAPIEKMVNIIKQLAEEPLRKPDAHSEDNHTTAANDNDSPGASNGHTNGGPQLETRMLENTILKIGRLLQVGFGVAGAEIVSKNMSCGDGELNIMMPGRCIFGIFAYVGMRRLATLADQSGRDITILVNRIAAIVHGCAKRWGGVSNQNIDNGFLLVWKLESQYDPHQKREIKSERVLRRARLADKALFCGAKIICEIQRYISGPKNAEVDLGIAFNAGYAIEGPVGSDFKIDASYLGADVKWTLTLQELTRVYDVPLIISSKVYLMASVHTKSSFMLIDYIRLGETSPEPRAIYALALTTLTGQTGLSYRVTKIPRKVGCLVKPEALGEVEDTVFTDEFPEYLFTIDVDVNRVIEARGLSEIQRDIFRQMFCSFVEGDWEKAKSIADGPPAIEVGPARAILEFMEASGDRPPEGWKGWHIIHTI